MCISFGKAEFEGTRILCAKKHNPETGQPEDVMFYDVSAKKPEQSGFGYASLDYGFRSPRRISSRMTSEDQHPGRAISLNLPTKEPLGPDNFISIPKDQKDLLKNVSNKVFYDGIDPSTFFQTRSMSLGPRVFDHDDFTIASSARPTDILSVIDQIPKRRRASLSPDLLEFYEEAYPDFSFAMAFWDSSQEGNSRMMLACHYQSSLDGYFFPAIDNQDRTGVHTGNAPENISVDRDHTLMWGSDDMKPETAVNMETFNSSIPEGIKVWLPNYLQGTLNFQYGESENGDFYIPSNDPRLTAKKGPWSGVIGNEMLFGARPSFPAEEYAVPIVKPAIWKP